MAKINTQIPEQVFELIRDQICIILTLELANQTLAVDFDVWCERIIDWNAEELPAVNVSMDSQTLDNENPKSRTGENQYFIDIVASANHQGAEKDQKGDVIASKLVQRIAGIISYILSSAEYYTLDFALGIVQTRWVSQISTGKLQQQNGLHTQVARVIFKVKANENVADLQGVKNEITTSQVKLDQTENGHLYSIDNS